jgi:dipeptidyl aminopeptidase/acylaminoacyl peptidase
VHGTSDALVPIDWSERFVAAAQRAGDTTDLWTFDGADFQPITFGATA